MAGCTRSRSASSAAVWHCARTRRSSVRSPRRRRKRRTGIPVLRALSLCTYCRHYPGAAAGRMIFARNPAVSAFPERVVGLACASSFSRLAQRSLTSRPAHSRCSAIRDTHSEGFSSLPPWLLLEPFTITSPVPTAVKIGRGSQCRLDNTV
jgi:hypothetical protein